MESKIEEQVDNHMLQYIQKTYINIESETFSIEQNTSIVRKDIELENNLLFILENFLTDSQSKYLINTIENLNFQSIEFEYPPDYRSCKRKIVFCEDLSSFFWKILVNYFEWEDLQLISPFGFEKEGKWLAHKVNPCLRFTKYEKGEFFKKHLDGQHVQNENDRSILTLMIYLNDDFKGGETIFYENENEISIKPIRNSALIFNHDISHEGKIIEEGYKYILRTDVMFKRYELKTENKLSSKTEEINSDQNQEKNKTEKETKNTPKINIETEHERSEKLFYESVDLQHQGNPKVSTQKYLEAQKIQCRYPTFLKKKLHKHKLENFPTNQNFNKIASPFHLEKIHSYLFNLDLLIQNPYYNELRNEYYNSWGYYNTPKHISLPTKIINKEKLEEIMALRLISRKFNKFFSGNFLWNKILSFNFPKNIFGIKRENIPNDDHYLEIFKLKSLEFKKNTKVFIDLGNKYIRTTFNLPKIDEDSILFNDTIPFNDVNGKIDCYVTYHHGHLWGSHSGFNFVLGKNEKNSRNYICSRNLNTNKVFRENNDLENIDYLRIVDIYNYIKQTFMISEFSISLPYFMLLDSKNSKKLLLELKSDHDSENNNDIIPKKYQDLSNQYHNNIFEKQEQIIDVNDDLRGLIVENLKDSFELPNEKLLKLLELCDQHYHGLLNDFKSCISRERLFLGILDKNEGVVIFLDGHISTFTYFIENNLIRDYCFIFNQDDLKSSKKELKEKFNCYFDFISDCRNLNLEIKFKQLNIIVVYEDYEHQTYFESIENDQIKNFNSIKTYYYQYDEIYNLGKDTI